MVTFRIVNRNDGAIFKTVPVDTHQHGDLIFLIVSVHISDLFVKFISILETNEHPGLKNPKLLEHSVICLRNKTCCLVLLVFVKRSTLGQYCLGNYERWALLNLNLI